jgi:hypothetical protein
MFFPDKDKSYREVYRVLTHGGHYMFNIWDSHRHNPFGRIAHEVTGSFFPADPPQFQSVPFSYRFEPIKECLIEVGFTDINAAVLRLEKEVPDPAILAVNLAPIRVACPFRRSYSLQKSRPRYTTPVA